MIIADKNFTIQATLMEATKGSVLKTLIMQQP